jgi:hypothetical protein
MNTPMPKTRDGIRSRNAHGFTPGDPCPCGGKIYMVPSTHTETRVNVVTKVRTTVPVSVEILMCVSCDRMFGQAF